MADEKKSEQKESAEKPAWEGSLSDAPFMPAPDGHDVTKDALAPPKKGK